MSSAGAKADRPAFGRILRRWRRSRGLSQLDLSALTGVPQRHVSFLETGRARPKEDMVLRLGQALDVPPREQNELLAAAGHRHLFPDEDEDYATAPFFVAAVTKLLRSHMPYPALVVDGHWELVKANPTAMRLNPTLSPGDSVAEAIFAPGAFRESLDNWESVARVAFARLVRDARDHPNNARLAQLVDFAEHQLTQAGVVPNGRDGLERETPAICPRIRWGDHVVRTYSMLATFTGAQAIRVAELRVELLFPADEASDAILRSLGAPLKSDDGA